MRAEWLTRQWFGQRRLSPALWLLLPLNWLFVALAGLKRITTTARRLPVPVVMVGNITVGGAGKTPLTLWLAQSLRQVGLTPGIVSRGYGRQGNDPQPVGLSDQPQDVGDEPLLLARRSGVPVWVGADRARAGAALLAAHPEVNIILCDDGLQHGRLDRDVELAVFDGRGAGNGWRLPLGPLREPLARLLTVDAVICNGGRDPRLPVGVPVFDMALQPGLFYRLDEPHKTCVSADLQGQKLFALAGIGHPERFFATLSQMGLQFEAHPFADHHVYHAADLAFAHGGVLLMTEKDAVKCSGLAAGETWVLPVEAELPSALVELVLEKLSGCQVA